MCFKDIYDWILAFFQHYVLLFGFCGDCICRSGAKRCSAYHI